MRLYRTIPIFLLLAGLPSGAAQTRRPRPEFQPVADVPGLPRVLLIGDSISIGYTIPLRKALQGVANLHRPPENCESTREGLAKLERWLGDGHWDVIEFNWGLHDLKYVDEKGKLTSVEQGRQKVPLPEYKRNLEKLVQRLERTGAVLIWRNTTPVPPGARGRIPGSEDRYNQAAAVIMARHGIRVNDMNGFIRKNRIPHIKPDNVHFSRQASAQLAAESAAVIREALAATKR